MSAPASTPTTPPRADAPTAGESQKAADPAAAVDHGDITQGAPEPVVLSGEEKAAQNRRNIAIALGLVAFVALVFVITLVRLKDQVFDRGAYG